MKWKTISLQARLYLVAVVILAVGLSSAVAIYLAAGNAPDNDLVYEFEHSKRYIHDLELYGGKMNVLANELVGWFTGLWHGRSLAYTVGVLSVLISLGVFAVASHLPPHAGPDARGTDDQSGTG